MPEEDYLDRVVDAFSPEKIFYDLIAVFVWIILAIIFIFTPALNETFLRIIFALPVALFIPGYSLTAALFPSSKGIDLIERIALSFALSMAVAPLLCLGLNYTHWGIRLDPIVISLAIFSVAMLIIAQYRRSILPGNEQYRFPLGKILADTQNKLFPEESTKIDRLLSAVLVISIVVAISSMIFVILIPKEGEHFTEFYILGEGGMVSDYPSNFAAVSPQSLIICIGNHESHNVNYIVETFAINQVFNDTSNVSSVVSMELLDRINLDVADNETIEIPYNFSISSPSYNKLQFLLFDGNVPGEDVWGIERINSSYRDLHLWVDVEEPLR
jgi:uncharacterized membrane protein